MDPNLSLLPTWLLLAAGLLFAGGLFLAFRSAPWGRLWREQALQHSFFGAAVVLGFLWQMRAGVLPELSIHIVAMTTVTLMLGWSLAVWAGFLALILAVVIGGKSLALFTVHSLVTVLIPVLVSYGIMRWERRVGFRNFFAYIFFCGFFGAGLAVTLAGCFMVGLLWLGGVYSWYELVHDYLRYIPLFALPEAVINGMLVTGLMVFHPERLLTLDSSRYE